MYVVKMVPEVSMVTYNVIPETMLPNATIAKFPPVRIPIGHFELIHNAGNGVRFAVYQNMEVVRQNDPRDRKTGRPTRQKDRRVFKQIWSSLVRYERKKINGRADIVSAERFHVNTGASGIRALFGHQFTRH
jgi:hypothetical protein